jgi:hypothetical protein
VLSIGAALTFDVPWLDITLLVMASFSGGTIDGAGDLLFLRAVHPYERSEMTTVSTSFREVTQVGPPARVLGAADVFNLSSVLSPRRDYARLFHALRPYPAPFVTHLLPSRASRVRVSGIATPCSLQPLPTQSRHPHGTPSLTKA